jgi:hypothetical protein
LPLGKVKRKLLLANRFDEPMGQTIGAPPRRVKASRRRVLENEETRR